MGYERFTRKRHALDTLPQVFADHRMRGNETDETLIVELYQQIGKLKVQLDWLKKKSDLFGIEEKRSWINRGHGNLSIVQQCALAGLF
ncbi:MAG: hypothetical protein IH794_07785 [Acidobacteria bacterium]|nr:hypothetical protein [Acidobacteriota bacterium]